MVVKKVGSGPAWSGMRMSADATEIGNRERSLVVEHSEFDVIVVGSGFGGSITANRLARAGKRVLVLERGPWRDTLPVRSIGIERRAPLPYGRKALTHLFRSMHVRRWGMNLHRAGMFELRSHRGLTTLCASAVGGGSTAYGGLLETPRDQAYWHSRHPQLDPSRIEQYYARVLHDMGAVSYDQDSCGPHSIWGLLPDHGDRQCRPASAQPRMGLLLPRSQEEAGREVVDANGVRRQYCAYDGDGFLGSRGGAKASVDFIYLAPVLGRGAQVRDLCEVTSLWHSPDAEGGGYAVHFEDLVSKRTERVRAKSLVLAAGTLNTLRILLASASTAGGIRPMPRLGQNFGANGDLLGILRGSKGQSSSFRTTPSIGAFTVDGHTRASLGIGGFPGIDTWPLPQRLKDRISPLLFLYGMGADSGSGSVRYHKSRLQVEYAQSDESIYSDIRSAFRTISQTLDRKLWTIGKPLTMHQWGGASVGPDPDHGVVDHRGEVYGNPGLFVADGSALPAAPGGPPSLTIAAWAHHVADGIASR
jgi:cholesterol oxidase